MRWGCLAGLRLRSPHARAHVHPASTQTPRAHNCGSRARLLLLLLLLLLSLACSSCFCCCCSTHPPWRTPTSRGHIRARGGSNPVVPSFVCRHAHATSERAISPLPGLGQTIRSSLSASGAGDAQGTAKHGQQANDSRTTRAARLRNVRQRAPIRPRGGGRHKGACVGVCFRRDLIIPGKCHFLDIWGFPGETVGTFDAIFNYFRQMSCRDI